jgi:manganese transport protein
MPHVIYLHSALMQDRIVPQTDAEARRLYRFTRIDVVVAMTFAGLINVSMLAVAAAVFYGKDVTGEIGDLQVAGETLKPLLGSSAGTLFALALLFSGLSSSAIGTLAGQVVMQGFLRRSVPIVVRRGVTMIPALVVIGIGANPTKTLVISQVLLSFGIPFALIPLVRFTSDRRIMGVLVNRRTTAVAATAVAAVIVTLNGFLLYQTFAS